MDQIAFRPIERRVLRLTADGIALMEIARRFNRSPPHIQRVIGWAGLPGRGTRADVQTLRPLERRILRWREQDASYADIAPRFRRSPNFVERVEGMARYKLLSE